MARSGLDRLCGILGEDFFLELGIEARAVGQFQSEGLTGSKGFSQYNQMAALRGGLFSIRVYLDERLYTIEPDGCDLSEANGDEILHRMPLEKANGAYHAA